MPANHAEEDTRRPRRRVPHLRLTKLNVTIFATLVIAPWLVILSYAVTHRPAIAANRLTTTTATTATTTPPGQRARPGPWGELELTPITIEPPAEALLRFDGLDSSKWHFADATPASVEATLRRVGLTDEQSFALLRAATAEPDIAGVSVRPEPSLVFSLTVEVRAALYDVLWACPKNLQAEPFRRPADPAHPWFAESGLSADHRSLARSLVYQRGPMEAFADPTALLTVVTGDAERVKLFRALSRQSSYLINVRVRPDTDVAPLIEYWGRNGREREVGPMLRALKRVPGGDTVDVTNLLPPVPRARVHTYPAPAGAKINGPLDCHWTSLNFWNPTPDDQFQVPDRVSDVLLTAYHEVEKPTQLGDIVLLINRQGKGIHSATYIADDLFLTKNGSNLAVPWQFMRLPELLAYYDTLRVARTVTFRKNGL